MDLLAFSNPADTGNHQSSSDLADTKDRIPPRRIAVIGLDGTPPALLFDREDLELPNIRDLMAHGLWGPLRSTDPPITIPAWTAMTTGLDPGELGLYGFRNRFSRQDVAMEIANAGHVSAKRVWTMFAERGRRYVVLGVPQTYPPSGGAGVMVAGFPVPDNRTAYTHPASVADEATRACGGEYMVDVEGFRLLDKPTLLNELQRMTDARFKLALHLATSTPWDFFMMVEIATDRLHHAFWDSFCPEHPADDSGGRLGAPRRSVIPDFYRRIDSWIGALLGRFDDSTTVLLVSDHGAKRNRGAVAINEWLTQHGYLVLNSGSVPAATLTPEIIDWSRTTAWGEGGYYARIFLNVKDREPYGLVEPVEYEPLRAKIALELLSLRDETGRPMPVKVLRPEEIYREVKNAPPDLMVYFEDLSRRASAAVGGGDILVTGRDLGPDAANHDMDGIFVMTRMEDLRHGRIKNVRLERAGILDIAPTILAEAGIPLPDGRSGRVVSPDAREPGRLPEADSAPSTVKAAEEGPDSGAQGYSKEEEDEILKRLADLGYV